MKILIHLPWDEFVKIQIRIVTKYFVLETIEEVLSSTHCRID